VHYCSASKSVLNAEAPRQEQYGKVRFKLCALRTEGLTKTKTRFSTTFPKYVIMKAF
jgi:hypothetical protein